MIGPYPTVTVVGVPVANDAVGELYYSGFSGAKEAKRERRVLDCGCPCSHATIRTTLIVTLDNTCCRWVFAKLL